MSSPVVGTSVLPVNEVRTQEISEITPSQKFEGHASRHISAGRRTADGDCSDDGSLKVWNLKSGKQIRDDWRDGDSPVWTIASVSPDGKKVVTGSENGGMRLWGIETGNITEKWVGHTQPVNSVCWSRDGRRVLSGSSDGTARQWDVKNGEIILGAIETRDKFVDAVVYSPDMTMFATAGYNEPRTNE